MSLSSSRVHIIGAGLAGSEAAFFLADRGIQVVLHEMRPERKTPAHQTGLFAELVCSNSFKSLDPDSAPGILKAEMELMGSLALKCAREAQVPSGQSLGVDRDVFAQRVTQILGEHPNIIRVAEEATQPVASEITLLATGPLTSDALSDWLAKATSQTDLYFYDAIAPIVDASTIDRSVAFIANRYGKVATSVSEERPEEEAYLNCPFTEEEYHRFIDALLAGEKVVPKAFEKEKYFQGCQPIEAIAATGRDSLRFGPMKPVGLTDPRTGKRPYACLQLRPENRALTAYNLVGFQTRLKYGDQSKVFRLIPGLEKAEFLRMGSIHRNTYVCGPRVLRSDLSLRGHPKVYLAGQITGVEGYLESAATGLLCALFILQRIQGKEVLLPPPNTGLGSLLRHVIGSDPDHYQPMNACFAIFDPSTYRSTEGLKGRDEKRKAMARESREVFQTWWTGEIQERPGSLHFALQEIHS